ncbi:MAG: hydantoinase/oxoprolinase family protein [Calditrichaeota bacterium]|nr:hydantoinase/oxoprolinase family protein [Calditrichota bacterium]
MKYKLGTDVGGTFTDFILISASGETHIHKTLSTPEDPSIGVISGIHDLADIVNLSLEEFVNSIETIVHGTTVATNALLTLKGAKTALITTKGVRDALEMRRGIREEQYNNHYRNVIPLVPRYLRLTVNERIDSRGEILTALDESDLLPAIELIKEENVEAVAVCYMNAYKNNIHEEQTVKFLKAHLPSHFITSSTEVLPSIRFYERVSTTVVNAYIGPVVANYLGNLTKKLDEIRFTGTLLIMQSNGGVVTPEVVKKSPAVTVLSGPAAAPTAGAFYANLLGYKDCITIDMGGTSFDASMVIDGQCVTSTDGEINRYKIALPSLDIATIGAGGGSIGWIDSGGLLQMGPQSAGALPGPICYNIGGRLPTCTDANLILGYLNPDFFAGGKLKLNSELTKQIISEQFAPELGLSALETCVGMFRIINSNMAQGVRQVSVERGYDPREFLFIVAGGAGSIHAGEICKELEIPMFVVPDVSSIFCAAGMLLGDLKHDYIRSYITQFSGLDKDYFLELYDQMKNVGTETLIREGVSEDNIDFHPVLDLRYIGQYHEVQLAVPLKDVMSFNLDKIKSEFHKEHNRLFGYSLEEEGTEIELINVRLRALGTTEKPEFIGGTESSVSLESALKEKRQVYIPESNEVKEVAVYDGDLPLSGNTIQGPAVIEKITTSIFVSESYNCLVDEYGTFIVYSKEVYPEGWILK